MGAYQDRRDIDYLYNTLFNQINGSLRVAIFEEGSDLINDCNGTIEGLVSYYNLSTLQEDMLNLVYPIGSIYQTTDDRFNPNISLNGLWNRISEENADIHIWERISEAE